MKLVTRLRHSYSGPLGTYAVVGLMAVASTCYLLTDFYRYWTLYDEGLIVYGASLVHDGFLPYTDFWSMYAPAQFYTIAGFFKIFGCSLTVARVWDTIARLLLLVCIVLVVYAYASFRFSVLAWVISSIWLGRPSRNFLDPTIPALIFSLGSCFWVLKYLADRRQAWSILAGIFTFIAGTFRHDIGVYTVVAVTTTLLVYGWKTDPKRPNGGVLNSLKSTMKYVFSYSVTWSCPTIALAAMLLLKVESNILLNDLVLFPVQVFPAFRSLPYPSCLPLIFDLYSGAISIISFLDQIFYPIFFAFPIVVFSIVFFYLLAVHFREKKWWLHKANWCLMLFLALGVMFFNQVNVRPDTRHGIPIFVVSVILVALLLHKTYSFERCQDSHSRGYLLLSLVIVAGCMCPLPIAEKALVAKSVFTNKNLIRTNLPNASGFFIKSGSVQQHEIEAVKFVKRTVPVDQCIFVGNIRHDLIYINDIMFYFLAERRSATRYSELHPGLATTADIQNAIVRDLTRIHTIVLHEELNELEPNQSSISSGVAILDAYIRHGFRPVKRFGNYTIWNRIEKEKGLTK